MNTFAKAGIYVALIKEVYSGGKAGD